VWNFTVASSAGWTYHLTNHQIIGQSVKIAQKMADCPENG